MGVDIDIKTFCQNLRATKPPYECPFKDCGKIYKSYCGICFHMYNFDHENNRLFDHPTKGKKKGGGGGGGGIGGRWHHRQMRRSPTPPDSFKPIHEALTYTEAQKMVEIDLEGRIHRINICEPLDIVYVEPTEPDSPSSVESPSTKASKHHHHSNSGGKARKEGAGNIVKLPEASFRIVPDYCPPDAPPRPTAYYRFIEKSAEEMDEEVEYDMDEEDCAWLDLMNEQRRQDTVPEVSPDMFELLMDRLEKESYFQSQTSGKDPNPSIDEDAVCCICNDGECQNSNAILFCDMCNLAVHQECYGVPYIPEGQWLCRRCLQSPSRAVNCVLCPNMGGAFKQTDTNCWAHVVCALWIPEVCFANTVFLEPIDSIENIPPARWKLTCYICKQRGVGACIQCHKANCYTAFHVTCAQQAGLYMRMEAVRENGTNGNSSFNVRKTAYCDVHTPAAPDMPTDEVTDSKTKANAKAKSREKMRKARKILAEKRSAVPIVSIPTIPPDRLTKVSSLFSIPKKDQFLQRLLGYWTLKRQSRNGVPLLRRLQTSHQTKRDQDGDKLSGTASDQLKYWQRLRQDLERARLLVELLRKREKVKREFIKTHKFARLMELQPLNHLLHHTLKQIQARDHANIFAEPVSIADVPDYLDHITEPMDFSTMKSKINSNKYRSLDDLEQDFLLTMDNCMTYNSKDTFFYKTAVRLREMGEAIIKQAKEKAEQVGYDYPTGLHLNVTEEISTLLFPKDGSPINNNVEEEEVGSNNSKMNGNRQELQELMTKFEQAKTSKPSQWRKRKMKHIQMKITHFKRRNNLETCVKVEDEPPPPPITNNVDAKRPNKLPNKKRSLKAAAPPPIELDSASMDAASSPLVDTTTTRPRLRKGSSTPKTPSPTPLPKGSKSVPPTLTTASPKNASSSNKAFKASPPVLKPQVPLPKDSEASKSGSVKREATTKIEVGRGRKQAGKRKQSNADLSPSPPTSKKGRVASKSPGLEADAAAAPASGVSRRSAMLFNKSPSPQKSAASKRATRGSTRKTEATSLEGDSSENVFTMSLAASSKGSAAASRKSSRSGSSLLGPASPLPETESFKMYRCSSVNQDSDSSSPPPSDSPSFEEEDTSADSKALKHLDCVWAKCRGYPWYPALIINPKARHPPPKNGMLMVPAEVIKAKPPGPHNFLVLFFDAKRTWQWLTRDKIEPLGADERLDRSRAKKGAIRKAYKKALASCQGSCPLKPSSSCT